MATVIWTLIGFLAPLLSGENQRALALDIRRTYSKAAQQTWSGAKCGLVLTGIIVDDK